MTRIVGMLALVVGVLLALKIAGFLMSVIWKIGTVVLILVVLYIGWQIFRRSLEVSRTVPRRWVTW